MPQLFMEERRRTILQELEKRGRVSVKDLSDLLDVSTVTIRQDLRALADENLLERTHGGAVLARPKSSSPELSFDVRQRENMAVKNLLAAEAASYVNSGDSIAMDASTTVFAMLPYLKKLERLIIVTNSLMIAHHCLESQHIQVLMPGGRLRRDSISLVGRPDNLPSIHLNAGFFGAHGITPETGITESNLDEVHMKQAMMAQCLNTYILVDERKWGKVAPFTLTEPDKVTCILTPQDAPTGAVRYFQNVKRVIA